MDEVKRIEIIASSSELGKILNALDATGVRGYAVTRNVTGKGLSGNTEDLDFTMLDNVYIVVFCNPELLQTLVTNISPLLNKFGGTCYVTDAQEIHSVQRVS